MSGPGDGQAAEAGVEHPDRPIHGSPGYDATEAGGRDGSGSGAAAAGVITSPPVTTRDFIAKTEAIGDLGGAPLLRPRHARDGQGAQPRRVPLLLPRSRRRARRRRARGRRQRVRLLEPGADRQDVELGEGAHGAARRGPPVPVVRPRLRPQATSPASTGSTRSAPPPSRSTTPSTRPASRSTPATAPSRCPTTPRPGPCTCASSLREARGSAHLVGVVASGLRPRMAHAIKRPAEGKQFGWDDEPEPDRRRAGPLGARPRTSRCASSSRGSAVLDDAGQEALLAGLDAMSAAVK